MKSLSALVLLAALHTSAVVHAANPMVEMQTSFGNVTFELYPDKAPKTVENFLHYVKSGFYKGTIFHRVVNRFVVQGGGMTPDLVTKLTDKPIRNEAANGLKNEAGTLAMARAYDPDSATSQFYVNLDRNLFLNHHKPEPDYYGYCVFGKVVNGMDVFKRIAEVPTGPAGPFASDVPIQAVVIQDMTLLSEPPAKARAKPTKKRKSHG